LRYYRIAEIAVEPTAFNRLAFGGVRVLITALGSATTEYGDKRYTNWLPGQPIQPKRKVNVMNSSKDQVWPGLPIEETFKDLRVSYEEGMNLNRFQFMSLCIQRRKEDLRYMQFMESTLRSKADALGRSEEARTVSLLLKLEKHQEELKKIIEEWEDELKVTELKHQAKKR
jgi:hypothetical protein